MRQDTQKCAQVEQLRNDSLRSRVGDIAVPLDQFIGSNVLLSKFAGANRGYIYFGSDKTIAWVCRMRFDHFREPDTTRKCLRILTLRPISGCQGCGSQTQGTAIYLAKDPSDPLPLSSTTQAPLSRLAVIPAVLKPKASVNDAFLHPLWVVGVAESASRDNSWPTGIDKG